MAGEGAARAIEPPPSPAAAVPVAMVPRAASLARLLRVLLLAPTLAVSGQRRGLQAEPSLRHCIDNTAFGVYCAPLVESVHAGDRDCTMTVTDAVQNMGTAAMPGVPIPPIIQTVLLNATNTLPGSSLRAACCLTCKNYVTPPGPPGVGKGGAPAPVAGVWDMPDWLDDWTDVEENTGLEHTSGSNRWVKPPAPETQPVFYIAILVVILPVVLYMFYGFKKCECASAPPRQQQAG